MQEHLEQFIEIRNNIVSEIDENIQFYLNDEVCCKLEYHTVYILMQETNKLLNNLSLTKFSKFPKEYLPKIKLILNEEEDFVEVGVQMFFNYEKDFIFLGHGKAANGFSYDLYCRKSIDPRFNYVYYARYGHKPKEMYKGTKRAAEEYLAGEDTPLSLAFKYAVMAGYVS